MKPCVWQWRCTPGLSQCLVILNSYILPIVQRTKARSSPLGRALTCVRGHYPIVWMGLHMSKCDLLPAWSPSLNLWSVTAGNILFTMNFLVHVNYTLKLLSLSTVSHQQRQHGGQEAELVVLPAVSQMLRQTYAQLGCTYLRDDLKYECLVWLAWLTYAMG